MSRPPACPCRTLLLTSSQVSSSRLRPTSSGSQSAALCSQARARSGARGPPAMLSRSAGLDPATGSGCKRGASRVVVGMGGSRPGVGAWVGSSGPASAGTSAENKTFLPAWTDDRCHALTSSACRNHPGPPFRMRERGDYRSMNSMNVTFLTREDEGFDAARQAWNLAVDQRPAAVAYANDAGEVAGAVRLAAQRGLRVAVQGTGHSAAPLGDLEGTLLLKTMRMTGLEVDPAARRARAEAGGLWRDVGVVGYLLGGGLGWLGRRHGLACNRVVSAEVVTADGELRRVGPDEEPELFWALRGGGGSFGAVTAIAFDGAYLGSEADGAEVVRPLRDVAAPLVMDTWATIPAPGLVRMHGDPEQPVPGMGEGFQVRELTPEAADAFIEVGGPDSGSPLLMLELRQLGGALAEPPDGGGALSSLTDDYTLFGVGVVMGEGRAQAIGAHHERVREAMAPWSAGVYLNFCETRGGDAPRAFDEATYARLREVKARYDGGADFVHPVEWSPNDGGTWWMLLRCGACGATREENVPDAEAERYDRELDQAEHRMQRAADRLSAELLERQADAFGTAPASTSSGKWAPNRTRVRPISTT